MEEHTENAFRVESDGPAVFAGTAAEPAWSICGPDHPSAEWISAIGHYAIRLPVAETSGPEAMFVCRESDPGAEYCSQRGCWIRPNPVAAPALEPPAATAEPRPGPEVLPEISCEESHADPEGDAETDPWIVHDPVVEPSAPPADPPAPPFSAVSSADLSADPSAVALAEANASPWTEPEPDDEAELRPFAEYDEATGVYFMDVAIAEPSPAEPAPDPDLEPLLSAFSAAMALAAKPREEAGPARRPVRRSLGEARSAKAEAPARAKALVKLEAPAKAEDPIVEDARFDHVETVRLKARHDGWTAARQRRFLEELADCGIVKEAAARVGMTAQSACNLRRRASGTPFGLAFEAALEDGMRRLHSVAFERAVEGVAKPVFYHGEKIGEHRTYDNRLLLSLLGKAGSPFDSSRTHEVRSHWEGWLDAVENGLSAPRFDFARAERGQGRLWQDEDGTWLTDFPPPEGAVVAEEQGAWGEDDYLRTLTEEELDFVESARTDERARDEAERDAFFSR